MDSTTVSERKNVDINDSKIKMSEFVSVGNSGDNLNGKFLQNSNNNITSVEQHFSTSVSSSTNSTASGGVSPPDGGWGWVVVFASFMVNLIADGVSLSFGVLFVDFVNFFGESRAKTSWVGSIFFSMPLLAGPIASYLSDRYGCRKVCIAGALLATGAFIASIFANSLEVLFFTFSLAGLGLALCYVTSVVVVAYYFEKKRSLATGLSSCGTGIGTFIFPPLTQYLLDEYAWQGTLLILSSIFLNMAIFGGLMRDLEDYSKSPKSNSKTSSDSDPELGLEESERLCSSLVQLPTYLHDNLPLEVISEISSKEGGYLNNLLDRHPELLNNLIVKNGKEQSESQLNGTVSRNSSFKKKSKASFKKKLSLGGQSVNDGHISSSKLDAGYLRNLRFQKGSITYRGAMLNIRRYRLRASSCPDIYRNSTMTIDERKSCFCIQDLKDLLLDMFNFSIFKNVRYTLFCLSNFLLYACVDVPYVYIPDHATHLHVDKEDASFLISFLGVLNTLGVVIVGYVGDKPHIDSSLLYSGFIVVSGLMLGIIPWIYSYYGLACVIGIYGFTISANYTLVPIIVVNIISLDSFTGAYGLLLLVQGIASLVGPPMAGFLSDVRGNYDATFISTGACVVLSGIMVFPIANMFFVKKSPNTCNHNNNMDYVKGNSRCEKVKFKEPVEVMMKMTTIDEDKTLYNHLGDNEINTPFLSITDKVNPIILNKSEISVFENPLSRI